MIDELEFFLTDGCVRFLSLEMLSNHAFRPAFVHEVFRERDPTTSLKKGLSNGSVRSERSWR